MSFTFRDCKKAMTDWVKNHPGYVASISFPECEQRARLMKNWRGEGCSKTDGGPRNIILHKAEKFVGNFTKNSVFSGLLYHRSLSLARDTGSGWWSGNEWDLHAFMTYDDNNIITIGILLSSDMEKRVKLKLSYNDSPRLVPFFVEQALNNLK